METKFEKSGLIIENASIGRHSRGGYGQYLIKGIVNGVSISVHSTNSEAFDWFNDDSNIEKHEEAIYAVNMALELAYNNL